MRDHPGPKALAPPRQHPEHQSVNPDEDHARDTFVSMRRAEDRSREQHAREHRIGDGCELALQIAAEDDFFAEARGGAHTEPDGKFELRSRDEKSELLAHALDLPGLVEVHQLGAASEHNQSADPECTGEHHIEQEVFHACPAPADQIAKLDAFATAEPGEAEQDPLPRHAPQILRQLAVLGRRMAAGLPLSEPNSSIVMSSAVCHQGASRRLGTGADDGRMSGRVCASVAKANPSYNVPPAG